MTHIHIFSKIRDFRSRSFFEPSCIQIELTVARKNNRRRWSDVRVNLATHKDILVHVSIQWLISIQLNTDGLADNATRIAHSRSIWIDLLETGLRGDLGAPRPGIERDSFHVRASDWSTCLDFIETRRWFTVRWLPTGFQEMQTYRGQTILRSPCQCNGALYLWLDRFSDNSEFNTLFF